MSSEENGAIGRLRVKKGDDIKAIYAKAKHSFTAEELQRYTQVEEMFPAQELVAELEAIHQEQQKKRKRKKAK